MSLRLPLCDVTDAVRDEDNRRLSSSFPYVSRLSRPDGVHSVPCRGPPFDGVDLLDACNWRLYAHLISRISDGGSLCSDDEEWMAMMEVSVFDLCRLVDRHPLYARMCSDPELIRAISESNRLMQCVGYVPWVFCLSDY